MSLSLDNAVAGMLVLPSPSFGDGYSVDYNATFNRNRSEDPLVGVPAGRPEVCMLSWSFKLNAPCGPTKDTVDTYLQATAGNEITIVDHNNRSYRGVILDSTIQATEVASDLWEFQIQFMGCELMTLTLLLETGFSLALEDDTCLLLESSA